MTEEEWRAAIQGAQASLQPQASAETFGRALSGGSHAVTVDCNDGASWCVKAIQPGNPAMARAMTAEQIAGRLARTLGAPVPDTALIEIPADLILRQGEMSHMAPGVAHGSKEIATAVSDRLNIDPAGSRRNEEAYGSLAVLYGLCGCFTDAQIVRTLNPESDVDSVDHGHFFDPSGPNWDANKLAARDAATPYQEFVANGADATKLAEAIQTAKAITDQQLAVVIGLSHPSWGVSLDDLVALGQFLSHRRDTLAI